MNYFLGLIVATLAVHLSFSHLGQTPDRYWDLVAFAMVFGGTIAVSLIILPWSSFRLLFSGFLKIGFHRLQNKKEFLKTNVEFLQSIQLGLPRPQLTESKF
ncbi:MAG: hypothetical protein KDD50_00425, partial [Bdellovibrionales bacterium]|nr:hypothetical protein [Bdellovibrionales bacterium]